MDKGRELLVTQGTVVIGTRADCELTLTDSTVSRRHASVQALGGRVRVRDLGSKNGLRFHGARLAEVDVPVGSTVQLGDTVLAIAPGEPGADVPVELAGLLGRSAAMRRLFSVISSAAQQDAAVLIVGETGSGKEGVARALHASSPRAAGPFVIFDCAAVQPELLQSALFGHVRGAFTDAVTTVDGALARANGGTLFLDEIAELPRELQPSLLRALETRTFTPVGGEAPLRSDFRILAATHQDLEAAVQEGRFRRDLYYRLAGLVVQVPPLRERPDDIPLLAARFESQLPTRRYPLDPFCLSYLSACHWPGNVRELRNMVERMVTLGALTAITDRPHEPDEPPDFHRARQLAVQAFERNYVERLLQRHGSVTEAAKAAGIARSYFYRLLDETGVKTKR